MRVLSKQNVVTLLDSLDRVAVERLLDEFAQTLTLFSNDHHHNDATQKTFRQPERTVISTADGSTMLTMPVCDDHGSAIKNVLVPTKGDIEGVITLQDMRGKLQGVLDAAEITAYRTALATMTVFQKWKHDSSPLNVLCFGAGRQAEWHVRLALLLSPALIKSVTIINRSSQRLRDLDVDVLSGLRKRYEHVTLKTMAQEDVSHGESTLQALLASSNVIFCCTPSTQPLFSYEELALTQDRNARRCFISMIGSYKPHMKEIDVATVHAAEQVFVDSREACLREAGELIAADTRPEDLIELGELDDTSKIPDRTKMKLTIFKCVGLAVMDLVSARALLAESVRLGIGSSPEDF